VLRVSVIKSFFFVASARPWHEEGKHNRHKLTDVTIVDAAVDDHIQALLQKGKCVYFMSQPHVEPHLFRGFTITLVARCAVRGSAFCACVLEVSTPGAHNIALGYVNKLPVAKSKYHFDLVSATH